MARELTLAIRIAGQLAASFQGALNAAKSGLTGLGRSGHAGAAEAGAAIGQLSGRTGMLPGVTARVGNAYKANLSASENAMHGLAAGTDLLTRKQKALHDYLRRPGLGDAARNRAEAAMRNIGRQQVALKRNEEALNRAMERGAALAEKRHRLYADMGKLSLQGAALLAPAGMAVNAAAQKQDTIRDIAITGGMSRDDEAALSLSVRNIARQSNQMQTDVLAGMQVLTAGGVQSRAELEGYGGELARVATATRASMDDLGATTLALRDNLGITRDNIKDSFNIMATGGKEGLVELKDMARFLPQIAPAFAAMGVTGNEAVAEITAALQIARTGAGTNEEAGTNMRNYLQKIFAPDTLKNFSDAGIDLKASLMQLQKDGVGAFEGSMMLIMQYLKDKSPQAAAEFSAAMQIKDDAEREQALARIQEAYALSDLFRDAQALNFLRPMMMQMDQYKGIRDKALASAKDDVIGKDFADRMESPIEKAKRMRVEFEAATESLGKALLPSALAVGDALLPMLQRGTAWIEQNQETVVTVAKLAAGLLGFKAGLLALRLGFSLFLSPAASVITKLVTFRSLTSAGLGPMRALLQAFGMGPKAAGLLAGGLGKAGSAIKWLGKGVLSLGKALGGALVKGLTLAGKAVAVLGRALLLNPVGLLVTGIAVAAFLVYKNWEKIKGWFTAGWNWLKNLGASLRQWGRDVMASIFPDGVAAAVAAGWEKVKAVFQGGINYIKGLPAQFLQMGKDVAMGLVNGITDGIGAAGEAIAGMADSVKNKFKGWLGINSPSRVFAGYGLNISQGAALGIRDGQSQAMSASAALAASAQSGWGRPSLAPVNMGASMGTDMGAAPRLALPLSFSATASAHAANSGNWTPPALLTAPDREARVARAQRATSGASGASGAGPTSITFSPTVNIQGNADPKAVHEGLALTMADLKRMLAQLEHDRNRRAYA